MATGLFSPVFVIEIILFKIIFDPDKYDYSQTLLHNKSLNLNVSHWLDMVKT